MSKFRYTYIYSKTRNQIFKLKVFEDDTYSFKLMNPYVKNYNKSKAKYSNLVGKPEIVIGTLKTLRLLYGKV